MDIVAVIPARAGSKRLPGKNIKVLAGKPLLAYTIEAALAAACFKRVIVSTEDQQIATVAKQYGAEVPWLRSEKIATDEADVVDVVLEVLQKVALAGDNVDAVMLLQPTSPFRSVINIVRAIELFNQVKPESVVSVSSANTHPFWCKTVDVHGVLKSFCLEEKKPTRFQDLPPVYQLNGSIYLSTVKNLQERHSFYSPNTNALIMTDPQECIDIDSSFDWLLAETVMKSQFEENKL
jgi:CMP-N,N'-diacetyllegionaminic acid synthase